MVTLGHFLILGACLFTVGVFGALTRRNAVGVLMAIELMLNAVNINLVAFSYFVTPDRFTGQIFTLFVITLAAAEAAVGLAIILNVYRQRQMIEVDNVNLMKW